MKISARSILMAGVATITASAVLITPSVQPAPPPRPEPAIQLTAQVQQLAEPNLHLLQVLLSDPGSLATPPNAGTPFPQPEFPPIVAPPSIGTTITGIYLAVEPWVRWGFEVAAYAVGFI